MIHTLFKIQNLILFSGSIFHFIDCSYSS